MPDRRPFGAIAERPHVRTRYAFIEVVWKNAPHGLASVCLVTAAKRPLRVDAPSTGWVTALAGLLACGSRLTSGLPSFPVAELDAGSPLTVAGAATVSGVSTSSVFPLSSPAFAGEPAREKHSMSGFRSQGATHSETRGTDAFSRRVASVRYRLRSRARKNEGGRRPRRPPRGLDRFLLLDLATLGGLRATAKPVSRLC